MSERGAFSAAGERVRAAMQRACTWLAIAITMAATGCGRRDPVLFAAVAGKVTVSGMPLGPGEAEIIFVPDASRGTKGPMSIGLITADGIYALTGPGGRRGAIVGHHRVYFAVPDAGGKIPQRFLAAATSPLTAEVQPQSVNLLDFNCETEVP